MNPAQKPVQKPMDIAGIPIYRYSLNRADAWEFPVGSDGGRSNAYVFYSIFILKEALAYAKFF